MVVSMVVVSPTHKRTEGRAPVSGSDFASKDAALHEGGVGEIAARLNVKWCDLPACVVVTGILPAFIAKSFIYTEIKSRHGN
jgi:hypothetical protein